jgi:hypothetical protein
MLGQNTLGPLGTSKLELNQEALWHKQFSEHLHSEKRR